MGTKIRSIHILNSNIDRVSLCLSNCQIRNNNNYPSIFAKATKVLDFFKETTVTFHILQTGNVISVFSTYFENCFDIKEISRWFAGEDSFVFFLDYFDDTLCKIELFRKYKFLTPLILQKNINIIEQFSLFKLDEIDSLFHITEKDLKVRLNSLEEYLQHFSSLLKIPLYLTQLDVISDPKTESVSFFV